MSFGTQNIKPPRLARLLRKLDVRTASCHIRSNGHVTRLTREFNNLRFTLVLLCVEYLMFNAMGR